MLWQKTWLETRLWFILATITLAAQVLALYMSYPLDPATSYPNGALGVTAAEMAQIRSGDFRAYVWVRWFSTTMLLVWPVFALRLAGTGFEDACGREYLFSLPVTRRRVVATRLGVVLAQIAAFTIVPSLLLCAIAPLVGQRYPIDDALVHSALLIAGSFGVFGLTMFLRQVVTDVPAYVAVGAIVLLGGLVTFMIRDVTPYSFFRLMNGADYFFERQVPWTGLAVSVGVGSALIWGSLQLVEHKDY